MKHTCLVIRSNRRFAPVAALLLGAAVLMTSTSARAYTNTFDTAASINGWVHWWGGAMETREFDDLMDADGNATSGSMKVTVPFNRMLADNQFSMWGSFSGMPETWTARLDGTQFAALEMDIRSEEHTSELQSQSNLVCR